MLVRAFEIERRPASARSARCLQHEGMRRAGIEPDIEDVADLLVIVGIAGLAEEASRRVVANQASAPSRSKASAMRSIDRRVAQQLAGRLVDEDGDRHAPGALARDAPSRAGSRSSRGCGSGPAAGPSRVVVDRGAARFVAQHPFGSSMRDEPLRRVAEDQRRLGAPGMRIGMHRACPRASSARAAISALITAPLASPVLPFAVIDALAGEERHVRVDRCRRRRRCAAPRRRCLRPEFVIVLAVAGRDMDEAGAGVVGDELAGKSGTSKS